MHRITITVDDELAGEIDRFMAARGYANRSEAIRDLARGGLQQAARDARTEGPCVAALIYTFDHDARELPKRLIKDFHHHHEITQATLHVHLDHDRCMEVAVLKGNGAEVQALADHVIAERGVRHGHLVFVPAGDKGSAHAAAHSHEHHHHHHADGPPQSPTARRRRRR